MQATGVPRDDTGASPRPAAVVVVGDVNSTMACTLAAVKLGIPVAHAEAGLRSFDRGMPEEINRLVTDTLADLLLVSEPAGEENLRREGIADGRIRYVGNVMIDTLVRELPAARALGVGERLGPARAPRKTTTRSSLRPWPAPRRVTLEEPMLMAPLVR